MLLRVEHLEKRYGGVYALNGVSFAMDAGTVLAIVGGNGAGKSTLAQCITGAETPDGGRIVFNQQTIPHGDPHASRTAGIEMIYQHLDLCLEQDVVTNVFLGRERRLRLGRFLTPMLALTEMERKTTSLLAGLNADIVPRKKVGLLSGGQRQVVAIARALLGQPKLLIMDEPTAALGAQETTRVLDLICVLKEKGLAIILISHHVEAIFKVTDRVVLMRHGQIVQETPTQATTPLELTQALLH